MRTNGIELCECDGNGEKFREKELHKSRKINSYSIDWLEVRVLRVSRRWCRGGGPTGGQTMAADSIHSRLRSPFTLAMLALSSHNGTSLI